MIRLAVFMPGADKVTVLVTMEPWQAQELLEWAMDTLSPDQWREIDASAFRIMTNTLQRELEDHLQREST